MTRRLLTIDQVVIDVDTLNIVPEQPFKNLVLYHLTATVSKKDKRDHRAIAALCSSQFKEMTEMVKACLEFYVDNVPVEVSPETLEKAKEVTALVRVENADR